ncbi:hypothetical protein K435DRAFT_966752 [Dendrothele bispora CBS 962.96]|uniref:Uncharacterized protein n=1 Tax=Dendrothele bispora (strain CBS 962.96) TaxID=1314807 RepID=A0A4S8LYB7_DENBC|nr:hypothetical protein K435DRAFT_966752 [Dendrothele bispora CBS 962.96]
MLSSTHLSRTVFRRVSRSIPPVPSRCTKHSVLKSRIHSSNFELPSLTLTKRRCNIVSNWNRWQGVSLRDSLHARANSTNAPAMNIIQTTYRPEYMDEAEAATIIQRANESWPAPLSGVPIPEGWSSKWDAWPYLFIFYWFSPHYLMLPHIEMMLNIKYGIPGDARPILFYIPSEEDVREAQKREEASSPDLFIFTVVERPNEFYFFDCSEGRLYRFTDPSLTETRLVSLLAEDPAFSTDILDYEPVPSSEEGTQILARIMKRDETVIPDAAKFLGYTPEHTEPWQENLLALPQPLESDEPLTDEQIEEVKQLTEEIASRSPEFKEASEAWDKGFQGGGNAHAVEDYPEGGQSERDIELDMGKISGLSKDFKELESVMREAEGELQRLQDIAKRGKDNTESLTPEELLEIGQQLDFGPDHELGMYSRDSKSGDFKKLREKDSLEVNEVDSDRVKVRVPYTPKGDS